MLTIRLARAGTKKRPFYHNTVTDSRNKLSSSHIERVGFFNPIASGKEDRLRVDQARVDYWVGHGAQLSERVQKLLSDKQAA